MAEADSSYSFRSYTQDDIPFIHSSWLKSYYLGNQYPKRLTISEFDKLHRPIRNQVLESPETAIVIACSRDNKDLILGWIAIQKPPWAEGLILHYVYTKSALKRQGIAQCLFNSVINDKPIITTHMTEKANKILSKKRYNFGLSPFPHQEIK